MSIVSLNGELLRTVLEFFVVVFKTQSSVGPESIRDDGNIPVLEATQTGNSL